MEWVWNPWGILGAVGLPLALFLAVVVFAAAPSRPLNRWLALVLFVEGITVTVCAAGLDIFVASGPDYYGMQAIHAMTVVAIPFLYLIFLGHALDTPLVRPLKHRLATPILLTGLAAGQALRFAYPERFVAGLTVPWYAPWAVIEGPWFHLATQIWAIISLFGLAAGIDAYRRSRTDIARRRAKWYVLAFGIRDIYWVIVLVVIMPYMQPYTDVFWGIVFTQGMSLGHIVFVSLLGYGMLKAHLFDIDLRLKWGLRQGTVAGAFVGVFFIVSELAQEIFQDQVGPYLGIAAAGALVFAMSPLQRLAQRLSDAAMPGVANTPEYVTYRKLQVYRSTLEGAWQDGEMTPKERTMLDRLRQELGIADSDAVAIEADVRAIYAKPGPAPGA